MIWRRNRGVRLSLWDRRYFPAWGVYPDRPVIAIRRLEGDWADWLEYEPDKGFKRRVQRPLAEHATMDHEGLIWC